MKPIHLAAAVLAVSMAACGKPDTRPGTLVGDAYIVTDDGREVSLAQLPLTVMADTPRIDTLLAQACPRAASATAGADSAAQAAAWQARARILSSRGGTRATTDANARYRVAGLVPGSYRVWADTTYGGARWTWLATVKVPPGDSARLALSNANPDDNPFRCER